MGVCRTSSGLVQCNYTAPSPRGSPPTGAVRKCPGRLVRSPQTAGAWAAARLQGGWERACPQQTQEGLLHLLSCRPTHPAPLRLTPPIVHQLRAAGETAGRCWRRERRVDVCLHEFGGGCTCNYITAQMMHLNTCYH